jgi:S-adenosylmethionine uptake transporter
MRLHIERGVISAFMALSWFFALTRLPLAEAIALSFIAPIIALYFASIMLGEHIRKTAIWASLLGFLGTIVIVSGRLGQSELTPDLALGLSSLAFSALLYAYNFVVIRRQSQLAGPVEIATFHSGVSACIQMLAAPLLFIMPGTPALGAIAISALLTVGGSMAIAWAYARAEAQVLVPFEYTGFLWAALFGWIMFSEKVTTTTLLGAVLIVTGCWIAARRQRTEQTAI